MFPVKIGGGIVKIVFASVGLFSILFCSHVSLALRGLHYKTFFDFHKSSLEKSVFLIILIAVISENIYEAKTLLPYVHL